MITLLQDLRYAFRQLRKSPGFAAVAILTLALGIGANAAIFSVVNGVLLRSLPYPDPAQIVQLSAYYKGELEYSAFSVGEFNFWKEHSEPFAFVAARTGVGFNLTGSAQPVRLRAFRVSSTYFDVFGVQPVLGRNFSKDEDSPSGPNVAILSYDLWKSEFAGDLGLVGKGISLDGVLFTVVGILPGGFQSIPAADLWTTIAQVNPTTGSGQNYTLLARVKNSASLKQADSYLRVVRKSFFQQFRTGAPPIYRDAIEFRAMPLVSAISADYRTSLLVLFGAIAFVLLIACVNLANLLLARSKSRQREFAVRAALGAKRSRLLSQLLTESFVLAMLGAALSVPIAYAGLHALLALAPTDLPRGQEISLDRSALTFAALLALACGTFFGIAPAFRSSRPDLNKSLKAGAGPASRGLGGQRLRGSLVVGEIALALILLTGASLLIETFANLLRTNPGFDPHHLLAVQIWPTGEKFTSTQAMSNFNQSLVEKLQSIPGVESAAVVGAGLPLERGGNVNVEILGHEPSSIDYREITPAYFSTLGVALLQGRIFSDSDSAKSHPVVVVNQQLARQYFADQPVIGQHLKVEGQDQEIVGIVGNVRSLVNEPAPATFFVPSAQARIDITRIFIAWFPNCVLVRTAQNPLSVSQQVVSAIHSTNPKVPVGRVESMDEVLSTSVAFQKFLMILMSVFAALALILAVVGIYGVMAYIVAQRTPEIGVRIALGASRSSILQMVLRRGMLLLVGGILAGLAGALGLTRLLAAQLYGVKPTDPLVFALVVVGLAAAAALACLIPARHAARVDPNEALRYE
jgi:predicted permease